MTIGTASAGVCYANQAEAAARFCATVVGTTSAGVVSCDGVDGSATISSEAGGALTLPYVLRVEPATGSATTRVATAELQACERYDLGYWSPWLTAWVLALAAILGARLAVQRIFGRETL